MLLEDAQGRPELIPVDLRVFAGYCLAAAVYVAIGVTVTDFLLSFWVGVAYVLVSAWAIPTAVRKFL